MVWLPANSAVVAKAACPEPFRIPVPNVVTPSMNVTVPAGTPAPELTVAVNVTGWPKVDGLGVREVVVVVLATLAAVVDWLAEAAR